MKRRRRFLLLLLLLALLLGTTAVVQNRISESEPHDGPEEVTGGDPSLAGDIGEGPRGGSRDGRGAHFGRGGGTGDARGGDSVGGGGSFPGRAGHRNLVAGVVGGGAPPESSVDLGLDWLRDHQSSDGSWDADGFCRGGECQCAGPGYAGADTAVTGLALSAFLGGGETFKHGTYKKTVRGALDRLLADQDGAGGFDAGGPLGPIGHALATQAVAAAWALTGADWLKSGAQRAVDRLVASASEGAPTPEETVWAAFALIDAKLGKLEVDAAHLRQLVRRLDGILEAASGGNIRTGVFPPASAGALAASAHFCRRVLSPYAAAVEGQGDPLDLLGLLPRVNAERDHGLLFFGTYAAFQETGDTWKKWNETMKAIVIPGQIGDGHERGSWDPEGPCGPALGRVGATALSVSTSQVYYRYSRPIRVE